MKAAVVAVVLAAGLTGCVAAPADPPPGFTNAQIHSIMSVWAEKQSTVYSGHIIGAMQKVDFVQFLPKSVWTTEIEDCEVRLGGSPYNASSNKEVNDYARAVCGIEYPPPVLKDRLRTPAQLDYTLDYYANVLVPCLRSSGVVVGDLPTRAAFRMEGDGGMFAWSPYDEVSNRLRQTPASLAVLKAKCPPAPPGLPDPGQIPALQP